MTKHPTQAISFTSTSCSFENNTLTPFSGNIFTVGPAFYAFRNDSINYNPINPGLSTPSSPPTYKFSKTKFQYNVGYLDKFVVACGGAMPMYDCIFTKFDSATNVVRGGRYCDSSYSDTGPYAGTATTCNEFALHQVINV